MGLDMYLLKDGKEKVNGVLGCMNGDLPFGISTDKLQIGYWRKAYSVMDKICEILNVKYDEINCVDLIFSGENIDKMISEATALLKKNCFIHEYDKDDWEDTLKIFKEAKNYMKEENTNIYFMCWY